MHHGYVHYLKDLYKDLKAKAREITRKAGLVPQPCAKCRSLATVPHHPNYGDPLRVIWYCKDHHAEVHKEEKAIPYWQLLAMAGVSYLTEEAWHEQNRTFHQRTTRSRKYEGYHFQRRNWNASSSTVPKSSRARLTRATTESTSLSFSKIKRTGTR